MILSIKRTHFILLTVYWFLLYFVFDKRLSLIKYCSDKLIFLPLLPYVHAIFYRGEICL